MAYIRPLKSGSFRADIRRKGIIKNKTFPTQLLAEQWSKTIEEAITMIPHMSEESLLNLSPKEIEDMGGKDLFSKLGVDLVALRNRINVEKIEKLSKKELIQLTPTQIDNMGGPGLFRHLGKRIRYMTFRDLCGEYLNQWNKKDYTGQMQRTAYWCDIFGDKVLTDIDIFDVREAIDNLLKENITKSTALRKKAVLSSIFKYALSKGYIDHNYARDITIENDSQQRERVLSDEERPLLLKACKQSSWDKLYLLVLMALTTGGRKSELMNLKHSDIDYKQSRAYLGTTKNGSSRYLVFPPVVMDELKKHRIVGNGLIFPSDKKTDKPFEFRKQWNKALRLANIENFTFHCLRHSAASYMIQNGCTLEEVGQHLGHTSVQTTRRYSHMDTEHKRERIEAVTKAIGL